MNKILVGCIAGMLILVVAVISLHEKPFDEELYPGTDTAKNFGSCIAYMQYVHESYSGIMDPMSKKHNDLAKDIVSLYYNYIKENHKEALRQIVSGYEYGKEFINDFGQNADYDTVFTVAKQLCAMTLMDSHDWAIAKEPNKVLMLLDKHNVTYQGYDLEPEAEYNLEDAI